MPNAIAGISATQERPERRSNPMKLEAFSGTEEKLNLENVDLGQISDALDYELSWSVALCMPLAVIGVTLIAQGAISSSDLCFFLGVSCIVSVVVLQFWARQKVKAQIVRYVTGRGLSEGAGHRRASEYLNRWLG